MKKRRTQIVIGALLAGIVLVVWLCYINRSWTEEDIRRAKVDVVQHACFSLMADGKAVAYFSSFSDSDSLMVGLTTRRDSALVSSENIGVWVNSSSMFPSANGMVMTVVDCPQMEAQKASMNCDIRTFISRNTQWIRTEQERMQRRAEEVDYYLAHHNIDDQEYIGVANFSYAQASAQQHLSRMLELLDSVSRYAHKIEVKVERFYQVDTLPMRPAKNWFESPSLLHMRSSIDEAVRFVVLRNDTMTSMPDSCVALSTPLFVDADFSDLIYEWNVKFRHLDYHSPLVKGGALTELSFYRYVQRDSLFEGASCDTSQNRYRGRMTEAGLPQGWGVMQYADGDYYEGEWQNGRRHGRGFLVSDHQMVQAGEWGEGNYLGEKMTHTAGRVYGIDISRYQHEIGAQHFAINWNAMRIISLGAKNSPQAEGTINYPVSFVFIKSTQGTTIKSAYYQQDARDARSHGIICGAYHFFSLKVGGREQAEYFLENTEILAGDMPPVLDVEPTEEQMAQYGNEQKMLDEIRQWLKVVERAVGKRPILYLNQSFVHNHLVHAPDLCRDYPVWIARYNVYRPEVKLLFWQLCYDGRVAGIHGGVDINVFNGYQEQYDAFVAEQQK